MNWEAPHGKARVNTTDRDYCELELGPTTSTTCNDYYSICKSARATTLTPESVSFRPVKTRGGSYLPFSFCWTQCVSSENGQKTSFSLERLSEDAAWGLSSSGMEV